MRCTCPHCPAVITRAATPILNTQQAREIASTTKQALLSGQHDFVRCNFANPGGTRGQLRDRGSSGHSLVCTSVMRSVCCGVSAGGCLLPIACALCM